MNANELAYKLEQGHWEGGTREQAATMLRQQQEKLTKYELRHVAQRDRIAILEMQHKQQQAEIEALKKQIPDWKNINKPNPFIGWEKNLVAVDSNPNSGLGGFALKKAEKK